ncbi:MAG: FAD-linked oxidase C-terminal domain-containing protein [Armatimonadota bacterium]|nr:FAD-linked oxidase C-terminal domain-containing protein [Armatimonadota bacterium]MDR7533194.1 FAD-linked oxidase C-terminal domain-containing protein [Armatimonadota bacterium]MDR7535418.1 FAD-linked oxidase C-terminal domain-containing protein [Armatimonadota bacterium]
MSVVPRPYAAERVIAELRALLGDRLSTATAVREHHSRGETYLPPHPPDAVAFPHSTDDVRAIVEVCARAGAPVIPFGAGTSLEGHVAATQGGICIDLSQMNRILRVSPEDLDATVEAGVTHRQLNRHLRGLGLFFSVDPGADATLGGMAATRASGTTAVRYGTMRENVLGLTVVLADGRVIRTGTRARKSAAGYDLTRLFVGSEGTLGVITEVTVRLHGVPEAVAAATCAFEAIAGAVDTVITTVQLGIPVARIELLDEVQMAACNRHAGLDCPVAPTLFLEFHGPSQRSVAEQADMVKEIALQHGGQAFRWATDADQRARLWKARHDAYWAALALRPGASGLTTDVCVPISRLAECIVETKRDLAASPVPVALVGHVGDGNFHLVFLVNPDDPAEMAEVKRLNERMVLRALALGGTCTGEHGVGIGKLPYMAREHGETLEVMRALKQTLDPHNIMNPGKLVALP